MNTYYKYYANVFLAKCTEKHDKNEVIEVITKHGKVNDSIVFNLIFEKDNFFYYSIVRADGFNANEWAKRKVEKFKELSHKASNKSTEYYNKSHKMVECIPMGQPILVGHHSEKSHRNLLDKSWNAMGKSVELSNKAGNYESKASYYERKTEEINLSMPESIDYFEAKLQNAIQLHYEIKEAKENRRHAYSLTYAKKIVKELTEKFNLAKLLWGD